MLSSDDLPTPSGPTSPIVMPAGISRLTASRASVDRYRCVTPSSRATGTAPALISAAASLQLRGPRRARIRSHIGDARKSAAHDIGARGEPLRIDPHADAEHELVAFVPGLDRLRRELCLARQEYHLGRDRMRRIGIEHDAREI